MWFNAKVETTTGKLKEGINYEWMYLLLVVKHDLECAKVLLVVWTIL